MHLSFSWSVDYKARGKLNRHFGSRDDVIAKLKKFGIAAKLVPREVGGTLEFDYELWLNKVLSAE